MAILHRKTLGNVLLLQVDANPDTSDTAPLGTLATDSTNGKLYINTDGATAWTEFGVAGGGGVTDPLVIQSNQEFSAQVDINSSVGSLPANTAVFFPFHLHGSKTAEKIVVNNGSTKTGTIDVGIYNSTGTRQVSSGLTTQSGDIQILNIANTVLIPGNYYMAIVTNAAAADFRVWGDATGTEYAAQLGRTKSLASAHPLPSDASAFVDFTGFTGQVIMAVQFLA